MHFLKKIIDAVNAFSDKIAVVAGDINLTYLQLFRSAYAISQQLTIYTGRQNRVCLIIANKSLSLYQSLFACFLSNLIYMPINVRASMARNQKIIQIADPDFIYIGDCQFDIACQFLCMLENKTVFILKVKCYELFLQTALPHHFVLISTYVESTCNAHFNNIIFPADNDISYLFFTSGSTGVPKGVPITNRNLSSYIDSIFFLFRFTSTDRVIQASDIAFDLSMHEIFTAWCAGATLYLYDESVSLTVAKFICEHKITHAFFVPSAIPVLKNQCQYFRLNLDALKKIFLCGEVFPLSYARMLESLAPHAAIVNLYGPTEATIACTYHFYRKNADYGNLPSVPIGFAFPTACLTLSDEGELIIHGEQIFRGYWPLKSNDDAVSYRTGDFVFFDVRWGYIFQTRKDDQWQIQGYRIEKNEVEFALRSVLRLEDIYVMPQYHESNLSQKLLAFSTRQLDISKYKKQLASFIPSSVIPHCCIQINDIPKLPNGKIDYKALYGMGQGGICV